MNHDETNPEAIDPALEARIVAWVLGEASPFEAAELERMVAGDPRLAGFKRRMEAVHGLVGEATAPGREPPLRMAEERRAKLLAVLGEGVAAGEGGAVLPAAEGLRRGALTWRQWGLPLAACAALLIAGFVSLTQQSSQPLVSPPEAASTSQALAPQPEALSMPIVGLSGRGSDAARPAIPGANTFARELAAQEVRWKAQAQTGEARAGAVTLGNFMAADRKKAVTFSGAPVSSTAAGTSVPGVGGVPATTAVTGGTVADGIISLTNRGNNAGDLTIGGVAGPAPAPAVKDELTLGGAAAVPNAPLPPPPPGVAPAAEPLPPPAAPSAGANFIASSGTNQDLTILNGGSNVSLSAVSNSLGGKADAIASTAPNAVLGFVNLGGVTGSLQRSTVASAKEMGAPPQNPAVPDQIGGVVELAPFEVKAATENEAASSNPAFTTALQRSDLPTVKGVPSALYGSNPPVNGNNRADKSLRSEVLASAQPLSTFSLHVSDASFHLAADALARGQWPDPAAIRPEEFYNAFDYGDPAPAPGEPVACRVEQSAHPFLQQRNLVRIAIKVPAAGRDAGQSLRLTVLLDTSGSMQREDRAATAQRAVQVLASLLGPMDRVTLIGFAREPRLLADRLNGAQAASLVDLVKRTPAEGGTNLEEALKLAGDHARRQYLAAAQNRIVVLTDGAANLGSDDPDRLGAQVAALRQQGIAFDACGIGTDGLNDSILEALTRQGNGRYSVINSPEEADAGFARQLAGAFRPAAENVKLQVRFNPARVGAYRLIGFEQHRLRAEDFRNDRVTAAQLAAAEAGVALYQVQVLPEGEGELGEVSVRFRQTATGQIVERTWPLPYEAQAPAFARATPSMQLAGCAAFLAEKLRGGDLARQIRWSDFLPVVDTFGSSYAQEKPVRQLEHMYREAAGMSAR